MFLLNTTTPNMITVSSSYKIIKKGFAYTSNGCVYFDITKFELEHLYGKLQSDQILDVKS